MDDIMRYLSIRSNLDGDWASEDKEFLPHLVVDGPPVIHTGLVDSVGNPIVRLPTPVGFGRDKEW